MISEGQLQEAIQHQVLYGGRLGTSLFELGFITEQRLLEALSRAHGVPPAEPGAFRADAVSAVPKRLATRFKVMPWRLRGKTLFLGMINPSDHAAVHTHTHTHTHKDNHTQPTYLYICIRLSDYQTIRLSDYQTIRLSDYQTIRLSEKRLSYHIISLSYHCHITVISYHHVINQSHSHNNRSLSTLLFLVLSPFPLLS